MICYADTRKRKSGRLCRLWAAGTGAKVVYDAKGIIPDRPAFFYGVTARQVDLFKEAQASDIDLYYADNAYAPCPILGESGKPLELFRITKGYAQCNGLGAAHLPTRAYYLPRIEGWRSGGREILVCLQSELYHDIWAGKREDWLRSTLDTIDAHTDRPVIIRDKPLRNRSEVPLEVALETAFAVVTLNSRVAIEATLKGIPAFATLPCAASPMCPADLSLIEHHPKPDGREEWAAVLAANQWTVNEIITGEAWDGIR
jgi:hypothetical protein